jgi:uncharacterized protein YacL
MANAGPKTPLGAIATIGLVLVFFWLRKGVKKILDAVHARGLNPPPVFVWFSIALIIVLLLSFLSLIILLAEGNSN